MHLKFNTQTTDTSLVHVFFNEVIHPALVDEIAYAGKLKKLMQINITNSTMYPYIHADKFSEWGIESVMERVQNLGFKYMVVWFDGCWPGSEDFEEGIMHAIENEWKDTNWLAAGHIINHHTRGDAPEWHEQCVVINVDKFKELDHMHINYWNYDRTYPAYTFSQENLHDDYTPMWVASEDMKLPPHMILDAVECPDDVTPNQTGILNTLFPIAFSTGCVIHNFNYDIRRGKICVYPEDDIEFTKSWLFDYDFNTRYTLDESRSFGYNKVHDDKRELFQYKVMDTHIMYVTNTEDVPIGDQLGIDTLVVPCSGLHQFKHITNNSDTIQRILWTDFSPFGIGWQKHVLANWDGKDFPKFYKDNLHVITDLGLPSEEFIWYDEQNALDFIDSYESEEEWLEHWNWIRTLSHFFVKIDVVKEWQRLADLIGNDHTVLLQLSNIWQYEINYVNTPAFTAQAAFVDLFNELLLNNETVYFSGDTPNGNYHEYQNMRLLPGIM